MTYNADGVRAVDPVTSEFTEPGIAGWTIFIDLDNDQELTGTEPFTITDADGHFEFLNLPPDEYDVIEIAPDGWEFSPGYDNKLNPVVEGSDTVEIEYANYSDNFGSLQGTIWNDVNIDAILRS